MGITPKIVEEQGAERATSAKGAGGTNRVQDMILRNRKAQDAWMAAFRAKDEAVSPSEKSATRKAFKAADKEYDCSKLTLFEHVPASLFEASLIAGYLSAELKAGHFDPEDLGDLLDAWALASGPEMPASEPKPRRHIDFEGMELPESISGLSAVCVAMRRLSDTCYDIDNTPLSEHLEGCHEDWIDAIREQWRRAIAALRVTSPDNEWDAQLKAGYLLEFEFDGDTNPTKIFEATNILARDLATLDQNSEALRVAAE